MHNTFATGGTFAWRASHYRAHHWSDKEKGRRSDPFLVRGLTALYGIIVALAAGAAAYWKYRQDLRLHEWDRARASFAEFMELAIQNPEFRPRYWSEVASADAIGRNKYLWFMARYLWACEDVLRTTLMTQRFGTMQ